SQAQPVAAGRLGDLSEAAGKHVSLSIVVRGGHEQHVGANRECADRRLGQWRPHAHPYPWCAAWEKELRELFAGYVEAKQIQNVLDYDDLLLYWAQTMGDAT